MPPEYARVTGNPSEPGRRERVVPLKVSVALMVFIAFIGLSSTGYYLIERNYGWFEAIYMTVITVTTVGLLEVGGGLSPAGRVWTIFVIVGGLTSGAVVLSLVVAAVVEGRLRTVLGRRHLERRVSALSGHVIICGYGRMGQMVAQDLQRARRPVVAVDRNGARTSQAERDGMLYVLGDAQEEGTLRAAGIQRAEAVVGTLPDDAANVFVTLTARGLNPEVHIIARARDPGTQDKLRKAGATRVICPHVIGAGRMADVILRPAIVDFVEMAQKGVELEMDQLTLKAGSGMIGRTLRELALPTRVGGMVAAVARADGTVVYNPGPDFTLSPGETLVLIGKRGVASAIQELEGAAGG